MSNKSESLKLLCPTKKDQAERIDFTVSPIRSSFIWEDRRQGLRYMRKYQNKQ